MAIKNDSNMGVRIDAEAITPAITTTNAASDMSTWLPGLYFFDFTDQ